jgi:hypothetical protein
MTDNNVAGHFEWRHDILYIDNHHNDTGFYAGCRKLILSTNGSVLNEDNETFCTVLVGFVQFH